MAAYDEVALGVVISGDLNAASGVASVGIKVPFLAFASRLKANVLPAGVGGPTEDADAVFVTFLRLSDAVLSLFSDAIRRSGVGRVDFFCRQA